ncbi:MAG: XisI protein [Pseudomonadota bacterium]
MDNLAQYRSLVMEILQEHARLTDRTEKGVESHTIFDTEHDRYMMFRVGWREQNRVHTPFLYIRFKNNKIWIEEDWTEDGIATDMLRANIPKEDIVLAFYPSQKRAYTEFATG